MIATLSVDKLLQAAARVGVNITPTDAGGNLYIWHTPERDVVYIGKSASDRRVKEEAVWKEEDPKWRIHSGIVTLLRVNHAEIQPLRYESSDFDETAWQSLLESGQWSGPAIDRLRTDLMSRPLTAEEVEKLLIRIGVRYGAPLGNAQFASQWEGPTGSTTDTLAVIAVAADDTFAP